jgi:phenylacetate-CoA ligase
VAAGEAASLLAPLFQLDRTQWLALDALLERQFSQLERLYAHACATVPYYAERWRAWGVEPGRRLTMDSRSRIPVLKRREAQDRSDTLQSRTPPAAHGALGAGLTSGSTGAPLKIAATQLTRLFWRAFNLRDHLWHGRDFSARLAAIRTMPESAPYPDGVRAPSWGEATAQAFETGPSFGLEITTKVRLQAEWLSRRSRLSPHPSLQSRRASGGITQEAAAPA